MSNKSCARTNEIHFVLDTLFHKLYRFQDTWTGIVVPCIYLQTCIFNSQD